MWEELKSNVGNIIKLQRMICNEESVYYMGMFIVSSTTEKDQLKWIKQQAKEQYLAMLHFDGLNQNTYGELRKEIHKAHQNSGVTVLPKRINRIIFLDCKHDKEHDWNLSTQRHQAKEFGRCQE